MTAQDPAEPAVPGREAEETAGLHSMAQQLRSLAERLRDPELPDERAAELAREAADLVGRAGNEIDRALADDEPS
jgi:hypothetical protein